jgi:dipeptidyl aminopeptidase/acylaminoacyl peptidase
LRTRRVVSAAVAATALGVLAGAAIPAVAPAKKREATSQHGRGFSKLVRTKLIHYRAHNGARRSAILLLPRWYTRRDNPPLPLIISPHGRGVTARSNALNWGALPASGLFAVINPSGQGRRLSRHSWGFHGQVTDLARMPRILERTVPWLRIDRERIYAFGSSMGGQETLLLAARYPHLLAGAAAFDSVTDFRLQYWNFPLLRCSAKCRRGRDRPLGFELRALARQEVGGSPLRQPGAYARRSPIAYARQLARSCVPLQLWWSLYDRIVLEPPAQSGRLFERIVELNPTAPVEAYMGFWRHSAEMTAQGQLPLALARFDLLPRILKPIGMIAVPPPTDVCRPLG